MGGLRRHDILAALIIALAAGVLVASPALDVLRGLSVDGLTALRWHIVGRQHDPAASPAVVVALDEETYRTPPFEGTPNVTWTREIGRVLTAVLEGGAKVVGFDIVFPTSIEQSEIPFGDETLGARVRGFDREYLRALAVGARAGKVVLGQVQHQDHPILPSRGQRVAVGQQRNIRPLNAHNDPDDIVRRLPVTFNVDGEPVPSMAVELATRARGSSPAIQGIVANTFALNFEGGAEDIPTYSLADLRQCADKDDAAFFRRHFEGKVVLIGTVLDVEDRKLTSKRFATGPEGARAARCVLPPHEAGRFTRDSIPGVYMHATAVNNLLRGDTLVELGRIGSGVSGILLAAVAAIAALVLSPAAATLAFAAVATLWVGGATAAFVQAVALPLVEPVLAGTLALTTTVGYRFVVADKDKRLLRKTFSLYLAPALVERMMTSNKLPALGGETREVTVFFSDVAGFSAFSEKLDPEALVDLMIEYLSAMTDIIEAQGGYVDKYIGDAIVAVFGAPVDDPDHAHHAVRAALKCRDRLEELNRTSPAFRGFKLAQRIGLNSGPVLVGNIGSRRRFNYTVMGDTVNLAARLEGANKYFATSIMASEMTVRRVGAAFAWRELDAIRVKGRVTPAKIYEPLAEAGAETAEQQMKAAAYGEGLARWRARDFAGAMEAFARVAADDPPSSLFLERAKKLTYKPPGPDWEPVNTLEGK
jgi:class 3 adenylate cyclase/CHASE2 domain-containing sensor protein